MACGKCGEKALAEQGKCFEFVAADGQRENGDIHLTAAYLIEEDGRDFLDDRKPNLWKFSRKPCQALRKKVRRDSGVDADGDGTADGIFLLGNVAARGFEFAENGAGAWEKGLAEFGEAHGTAETIEDPRTQLIF